MPRCNGIWKRSGVDTEARCRARRRLSEKEKCNERILDGCVVFIAKRRGALDVFLLVHKNFIAPKVMQKEPARQF